MESTLALGLCIFLLLLAGINVYLSALAAFRRITRGATEFSFLLLATAFYCGGYALELVQTDVKPILDIIIKFEYLGIAPIPACLFLFAYVYTTGKKPNPWMTLLLFAIPLLSFIMVFTVHSHNFYYINPRLEPFHDFFVLAFERGIFYWVNSAFLHSFSILSVGMLIRFALTSQTRLRKKAWIITIGAALPILSVIVYMSLFKQLRFDITPFSLSGSVLLLSTGIFKFGLFEVVPYARSLAVDALQDAFVVCDRSYQIKDLNSAAQKIPGLPYMVPGIYLPEEHPFTVLLEESIKRGDSEFIYNSYDMHNTPHYYRSRIFPVTLDDELYGYTLLISDETLQRQLMQKLETQAAVDELTGSLNRRSFIDSGFRELDKCRINKIPFGLIIIDLDDFKEINDTMGHLTGDFVLKTVVKRFMQELRSIDLLARYGGDEFAVILPGSNLQNTLKIAGRLRHVLRNNSVQFEDNVMKITASFGVTALEHVHGDDPISLIELFKQADQALYLAKEKGKDVVMSFVKN